MQLDYKTFLNIFIFSFSLFVFFACDIKENKDVVPTESFFRIIESEQFGRDYIPLDIKQTAEGGYLILAKTRTDNSDFYGVYLLKTDSLGNFKAEQTLDPTVFVNPLDNFLQIGSDFYFFCMNGLNLEAKLMKVDAGLQVSEIAQIGGASYPLAASLDGSEFVLQCYQSFERKTYLLKVNTGGNLTAAKGFDVGFGNFDVEEPIFKSLIGTAQRLPFLVGKLDNGLYFFNGFYNFTLSMVFVDFSTDDDTPPGVLQGYRDERGISAAFPLGSNKFALSRFGFGDNFIVSQTTLNTQSGAIASSSDIQGNIFPELIDNAPIILKEITILEKPYLVYGSTTRSGQMVLYAFDKATGEFAGSKYLGYSSQFVMGGFAKTIDEGLVVSGTTYVAGRFQRICLFKISKADLEGILKSF